MIRYFLIFYILLVLYPCAGQVLRINEFSSDNDGIIPAFDGNFYDWIEIKNMSADSINLNLYCLSDKADNLRKWRFPAGKYIHSGEIILVWASELNMIDSQGYYHTNFKINKEGEDLFLVLRATYQIIDHCNPLYLDTDVSYGRIGSSSAWYYFPLPTPGAENTTPGYTALLTAPVAGVESGWYADSLSVNFTSNQTGVQIRYTMDGSTPTEESPVWPGQIYLHNRTSEPNVYSMISTVLPLPPPVGELDTWLPPLIDVPKIHTMKLRCFQDGAMPSKTLTKIYMVGIALYDFPIVALTMNPADLFDPDIGIYVAGTGYDGEHVSSANFDQNWERAVVTDWFDTSGNHIFQKDCEIEIHGTYSSRAGQKPLRMEPFVSTDSYLFDYPFFGSDYLTRFYSLILRNSGNDVHFTMFRDNFVHTIFREQNLAVMNYKPYIVFLDGEYWGIHILQEHAEEHYISNHFNVSLDSLDVVERDGYTVYGHDDDYEAFRTYIDQYDETDPAVWQYINTKVDLDNFREYMSGEIYTANSDWPGNNIRYWRKTVPYTPDAPYGHDGRYRWLVYDLDWSYGLYQNPYWSHDTLGRAINPDLTWRTLLLRNFLHDNNFKNDFINTLADRLNYNWVPSKITSLIDEFEARYETSMPMQIDRWRLPQDIPTWHAEVNALRLFAQNRPDFLRNTIVTHFMLEGTANVTLQIEPIEAAVIRMNDRVDLTSGSYIYFQDIPVTLRAVIQPGWEIVSFNGLHNDSLSVIPIAEQTIQLILQRLSPKNVILIRNDTGLTISWDAVTDAVGYIIEAADSPYAETWDTLQSTTEDAITLISNEDKQFYRVKAIF